MRAARFHAPGTDLVLEDIEDPSPGPGDVVVKVAAAGVCGTELHFIDGLLTPAVSPITLGHEVAGTVSAIGDGVEGYVIGDRVVVNYFHSCGSCARCLVGQGHLCDAPKGFLAFVTDGGFAEQVRVPASALVSLPASIGFAEAAPLCCSAATALHATRSAGLSAGETAVVLGVGGIGLALVQMLRIHGVRVIAVGRSAAKRELACALGADAAVDAAVADVPAAVRERTHGRGADAVFDMVGTKWSSSTSLASLAKGGALVFIGYSFESIELNPLALVVSEHRVLSSVGNTHAELCEVIGMAEAGMLLPTVAETAPLNDVNRILGHLRDGAVVGRAVLLPG